MEAAMLTHTSHPPEISGVRPTTLYILQGSVGRNDVEPYYGSSEGHVSVECAQAQLNAHTG